MKTVTFDLNRENGNRWVMNGDLGTKTFKTVMCVSGFLAARRQESEMVEVSFASPEAKAAFLSEEKEISAGW